MPASSHSRQRNNAHTTPPPRAAYAGRPVTARFLARSGPPCQSPMPAPSGPPIAAYPARRLAVEERTNRRANAATRSRSISGAPRKKKSAAPHTRQRPPPLAVKCAELPQLPQRSTGRRNPIPQHPRSAANRIARRRRASPPDQSRKCSRWGKPGFRRPAPPPPRATAKARRTCQGLLHYRTGGQRPPPAASGSNAFRRPASRRPPGPRVCAAPTATATRAQSV